jgi:threonine/homoserine/homoserine lactone efflux protein
MDTGHGFLMTGLLFGLTAGISPGPLLTLVITETLKHGRREGLKVAFAPLLTDAPIVVFVVYILNSYSHHNALIGGLTLIGACYVIYLGIENILVKGVPEGSDAPVQKSALLKGVVTNALNPHPYIFWLSIGAPIVMRALSMRPLKAVFFILGFYILLIGSKVSIVFAVNAFRSFLKSRIYLIVIRVLGAALIVFGLLFIRDGIQILRTGSLQSGGEIRNTGEHLEVGGYRSLSSAKVKRR